MKHFMKNTTVVKLIIMSIIPMFVIIVATTTSCVLERCINGYWPWKEYLAKEIKENGICHIEIDKHFAVYFEDDGSEFYPATAHLYKDGVKTKNWTYTHLNKDKNDLVHYLLWEHYKPAKVITETKHYEPCLP